MTEPGLDPTASEQVLTTSQMAVVATSFAQWLGVGPSAVIVFPVAHLQPVPKPPRQHRDGRGRLPTTVTAEGARHPVWWLDAHTKWQDPDEDDLAYGLRLTETMEDRHLVVAGDGPIDVLAWRLGWTPGQPATDARILAYAAGGWDLDLCRLELATDPLGALPRRDARKRRAQQRRRHLPTGRPGCHGAQPEPAEQLLHVIGTVPAFPDGDVGRSVLGKVTAWS